MSGWAAFGQAMAELTGTAIQSHNTRSENERNRNFQKEMSNTAYQRAATDLEKAGLNRILALGSSASTPSGSAGSFQAPNLGSAISTGMSVATAKQGIEQSKATEHLQKEQKSTEMMKQSLIKEQAIQAETQADLNSSTARYFDAKATKEELFNPAQKLGNEMLEKFTNFGRSAAKEYTDFAEKVRSKREHTDLIKRNPRTQQTMKKNSDRRKNQ